MTDQDMCDQAIICLFANRNKDAISLISSSMAKIIGMLKEKDLSDDKQAIVDDLSKRQWHVIREFNEINQDLTTILG